MGYRNIKKQKKLIFLFKLRILIFQCPGTTHITNCTRMPPMMMTMVRAISMTGARRVGAPSWCCTIVHHQLFRWWGGGHEVGEQSWWWWDWEGSVGKVSNAVWQIFPAKGVQEKLLPKNFGRFGGTPPPQFTESPPPLTLEIFHPKGLKWCFFLRNLGLLHPPPPLCVNIFGGRLLQDSGG